MALVAETGGRAAVVADEHSSSQSAVSWAAVIGGALAAVAITLLLVALGSGIGLSSISPWTALNPSATTFTLLAAVWLIIVQWLSSALGGYISGRLRTKWAGLHTDEVFFRDTVHGFLAWALASVLVVAFATSSISSAVSSAGRAVSNVAGSAASTATQAAESVVRLQRLFPGCAIPKGSARRQHVVAGCQGGGRSYCCQSGRQREPRARRPHIPCRTGGIADRPFPGGCREACRRYHGADQGGRR